MRLKTRFLAQGSYKSCHGSSICSTKGEKETAQLLRTTDERMRVRGPHGRRKHIFNPSIYTPLVKSRDCRKKEISVYRQATDQGKNYGFLPKNIDRKQDVIRK